VRRLSAGGNRSPMIKLQISAELLDYRLDELPFLHERLMETEFGNLSSRSVLNRRRWIKSGNTVDGSPRLLIKHTPILAQILRILE
jgi:hypothetical protein